VLDVASHGSKVMVKVRHNLLVRPFHMAKHAVPALATDLLTVPFIVNSGALRPSRPSKIDSCSVKLSDKYIVMSDTSTCYCSTGAETA
jgi:hypothetical protein